MSSPPPVGRRRRVWLAWVLTRAAALAVAAWVAHLDRGNVYFDIPTGSVITPYVGAGIGYGWSDDKGDDESGVTYALMAGVEVNITDNLSADVGYRFRQIIDSETYANEALVGLRYGF